MKDKATIKVKPIPKNEVRWVNELILLSFIVNLIIALVTFVLVMKGNGFKPKPIPITTHNSLLITLFIPVVILGTILLSTFVIFIMCPNYSLLESKYRLTCSKCRRKIYECTDGSYACWCGCEWSKEEVEQAIKEYNYFNKIKQRVKEYNYSNRVKQAVLKELNCPDRKVKKR